MRLHCRVSIPFFFEPNFDALIEPLAAARRIRDGTPEPYLAIHGRTAVQKKEDYKPVVYGDFLLKKVSNNFSGGGKYAEDE